MAKNRTHVSDQKDTKQKVSECRNMAADGKHAVTFAKAIAANPSLLDGLGKVVATLAQNEKAAEILESVFAKHAKRYPATYRAYVNARFAK